MTENGSPFGIGTALGTRVQEPDRQNGADLGPSHANARASLEGRIRP